MAKKKLTIIKNKALEVNKSTLELIAVYDFSSREAKALKI